MEKHPTVLTDVKAAVKELLLPLVGRKKVLFACRENACRSQMAAAFAQYLAGDKIEAASAGSEPAVKVNPDMVGRHEGKRNRHGISHSPAFGSDVGGNETGYNYHHGLWRKNVLLFQVPKDWIGICLILPENP